MIMDGAGSLASGATLAKAGPRDEVCSCTPCPKPSTMDMPTACPRFFTDHGMKEDKALRSAELALGNLAIKNTDDSITNASMPPPSIGAQGLRRASSAGRPPLSPTLPVAGRRKRIDSGDFPCCETETPSTTHSDLGYQRTLGRESPPRAKPAAKRGKMGGAFPSVSNLSAFIGSETETECGPPTAYTVRTSPRNTAALALLKSFRHPGFANRFFRAVRGCGEPSQEVTSRRPAWRLGNGMRTGDERTLLHPEQNRARSSSALWAAALRRCNALHALPD